MNKLDKIFYDVNCPIPNLNEKLSNRMDDLDFIEVIMEIEKVYGVIINEDRLNFDMTYKDFIRYLYKNHNIREHINLFRADKLERILK